MQSGIRCFAGANTARGFVSGFDGVFSGRRRVFYIKGAPGVGKSGLMRRVAGRQSAAGHAVSLFSCSSDPDSLDGIVDETLDVAMLDATSPHAYDPLLPGARDILLNLGEFLDCDALSGDVSRLEELRARTAECFRPMFRE